VPEEDTTETDGLMRIRYESASEYVTISGKATWATDNEPIAENKNILPLLQIPQTRVVVYGRKSSFSMGTYNTYEGKVNSAAWEGAAAETVLFESYTASQKYLGDGSTVWDIELVLLYKPSGWNNFYRESTGQFEAFEINSSDPYTGTSYSGLLS
jgi:hypothetical protein